MIISGTATINGTALETRDAIGIWDVEKLDLQVHEGTELLLIEVPMEQ